MLVPWTANTAVKAQVGSDVPKNVLRVEAERDSVHLSVNGSLVAALPRAITPVDGDVGLRAGQAMKLHISTFDVIRLLAPLRGGP